MRPEVRKELLRKAIHIAFGFCALLLRWLPVWAAAAVALAAFLFNWKALPRLFGRTISRDPRGTDRGILLYPVAVFVLIVTLPGDPGIAAAVWAILAFGDGLATVAGRVVGGPRLPWNRSKTWVGTAAFAFAGGVSATMIGGFVDPSPPYFLSWAALGFVTAAACAIGESLDIHVDDNIVVPVVGGLVMIALTRISREPEIALGSTEAGWLATNALLAIAGFAVRSVTISGAIGGFVLGAVLILFAGWPLYVVLLAFFVIGTAVTKLGYRRKAEEGLAQEGEGRRRFTHAFSNVGVAAVLSVFIAVEAGSLRMLWLGAIAALATAAADTTASEIGQLLGKRAFLPLTFQRVPRGTEGAISVEGTVAGALAGVTVGALGVILAAKEVAIPVGAGIAIVSLAAITGSWLESVAGSWNRRQSEPITNGALNFFNTLVGASIAMVGWAFVT